jgi:anti-sigma factor RsiW
MLEAGDRLSSREELLVVEDHLAQCAACSAFKEFWENIRAELEKAPKPELPAALESRVRSLCLAEIIAGDTGKKRPARPRDASVPWPVWTALAVLTALTVALLVGGVEEFSRSREVTVEILFLLVLILQNGLTLFFMPVIMRRRRLTDLELGLIE